MGKGDATKTATGNARINPCVTGRCFGFLSMVATLYSYSYKTATANTKIDLGVASCCFWIPDHSADSSFVFTFPPIK